MSERETSIETYVRENRQFLPRVLATGDPRAQAHVLALLQEGGSPEDIDQIIDYLQQLKLDAED